MYAISCLLLLAIYNNAPVQWWNDPWYVSSMFLFSCSNSGVILYISISAFGSSVNGLDMNGTVTLSGKNQWSMFFSYMIIVIHRGSELTLDNPVIQKL